MKKTNLFISILLTFNLLFGCSNSLSCENDVDNNDNTTNINSPITKSDIENLNTGNNDTFYLSEKNSEFVSGDFSINDKFNGDLTFLCSQEKEINLSLYINNVQTPFKINNNESKTHKLKLSKGKNIFDVEVEKNINLESNKCVFVTSNTYISNSISPINYIPFNLLTKHSVSLNSFAINNSKDIVSYKILNDTKDSFIYIYM